MQPEPLDDAQDEMQVYVFAARGALTAAGQDEAGLAAHIRRIAETTDTRGLVVALYLLNGHSNWKAHTFVEAAPRAEFARRRPGWAFVERFGTPPGLPERLWLIRMAFGMATSYPQMVSDVYGWQIECPAFCDHLAYMFAHELHHFRRYRLGLHGREGEQAACKWALKRAGEAGYAVRGEREPPRVSPRAAIRSMPEQARPDLLRSVEREAARLSFDDLTVLQKWVRDRLNAARQAMEEGPEMRRFEELRALPDGTMLLIVGADQPARYLGQTAVKIGTLRRSSYRLAVRTEDGQEWYWPMQWLRAVEPTDPAR